MKMSIMRFAATTVAAYILYGALYMGGAAIFADQMAAMQTAMVLPEDTFTATMAYHLVQTIAVVWLFDKAVGSDDMKAGALFGVMIGLYLMATNAIWFANVKDMPQDARVVMSLMDIIIGAIIGVVLAKLHSMGRSEEAAD